MDIELLIVERLDRHVGVSNGWCGVGVVLVWCLCGVGVVLVLVAECGVGFGPMSNIATTHCEQIWSDV